jgi:NADPH-dependent ferric siderophore reductase
LHVVTLQENKDMPTVPKWLNDTLERLAPSMLRMVKVTDITYLSPNVKKIRMTGDFSKIQFDPGYTISFRVSPTELRHYTVSYGNTTDGVIEFIAYIHGDAVGANFMKNLIPGDEPVQIAVLGSNKQYNPTVKKQLVFGDETSLSLMSSFQPLFVRNEHTSLFLIELDEINRGVPKLLGLENYAVYNKHDIFRDQDKTRLNNVIYNSDWTDANVILTGNVHSLQNFRKVLKELNHKGRIYVKGYWVEGKKGL